MAIEHEALQKPWMLLSVGSLGLLLFWFIPMALVLGLIGLTPLGLFFIGLISVLLLISLTIWAEITASGTCQIFNAVVVDQENSPETQEALKWLSNRWEQVVILVLLQPALKLQSWFVRILSKKTHENLGWQVSSGLMLPILAIEDTDLSDGAARIRQIMADRLLRFRPEFIRVNLVARAAQWVMILLAILMGFLAGLSLSDPQTVSAGRLIIGGGFGMLIAVIFVVTGLSFSTFIRACYHSALLLWVKNTEKARLTGDAKFSAPPAILAQVLGVVSSVNEDN
jgi:hypothetical protein